MLKNITLSADEKLIQKAREKALKQNKSLNQFFRDWLTQFTNQNLTLNDYESIINQFKYARAGKKFSREEMNER